jgi:holin-like protein
MPQAFLLLVALQLAGEVAARALGLPVPGTVLGLAALFAILCLRGRRLGRERAVPAALASVAAGLHGTLGLLFVPAGVGILAHLSLFAQEGPAILAAVLASTLAAIAVTATIAARQARTARRAATLAAEARR